jgi:hypothetical protein
MNVGSGIFYFVANHLSEHQPDGKFSDAEAK